MAHIQERKRTFVTWGYHYPRSHITKQESIQGDIICMAASMTTTWCLIKDQDKEHIIVHGELPYPSPSTSQLSSHHITYIAVCDTHVIFIANQHVWGWGRNDDGQLAHSPTQYPTFTTPTLLPLSPSTSTCTGTSHAYVLTCDGHIMGWGRLPARDGVWMPVSMFDTKATATPTSTSTSTSTSASTSPSPRITFLTCSWQHALAISNHGDVYTWGVGLYGNLGCDDMLSHSHPTKIDVLCGMGATRGACSPWHTIITTSMGCYVMGQRTWGQIGDGRIDGIVSTPQLITWEDDDDDVEIIDVACGTRHTIARAKDGSIWTRGWNAFGQVNGKSESDIITRPHKLDLSHVTHLTCGAWHSVAIMDQS